MQLFYVIVLQGKRWFAQILYIPVIFQCGFLVVLYYVLPVTYHAEISSLLSVA